jgi:hypothetical protein
VDADLSITRSYESHRDLITAVQNAVDTTTVSRYEYDNDDIGRRTVAAHTGTAFAASAFNLYGYNDRGEVTDARRYLGTDTSDTSSPVSAQDWEYEYDSIGNRESRTVAQGTPTTYTANQLNQYTATADPAEAFSFDTDGNMTGDGTWDYTWNAANRLTAAEPGTPATGSRVPGPQLKRSRDAAVLRVEVPAWIRRHTRAVCRGPARVPSARMTAADGLRFTRGSGPWFEYTYDYMGRRVRRKVYTRQADTTRSPTHDQVFVYDGWSRGGAERRRDGLRPLQRGQQGDASRPSTFPVLVLDATDSNAVTRTFTWGLDLSGTLQGAGGIGGLLRLDDTDDVYFYTCDANGNISELIDDSGNTDAHYEYTPFGSQVVATGPCAAGNPFRFSTKYHEEEIGLYYYGFM